MHVIECVLCLLMAGPVSKDATVIHDVVYGHKDGLAMTYDFIVPSDEVERNGATVALIVSGGWRSRWFAAEKLLEPTNGYGTFIRSLLVDGYSIALIRHGSAPKYDVVDASSDVKKALRHMRTDLPKRGLDPERIGVFGFSAGGHLSLLLGTMGGEQLPKWVKRERSENAALDAPVAAVVAWFAPSDLRVIVGPHSGFEALDFDPEDAPGVSPLTLVDKGDAPTLLMHGDSDRLVPLGSSRVMYGALKAAEIETQIEVFEGQGHGFKNDAQRRSERLAKAWFDAHLLK